MRTVNNPKNSVGSGVKPRYSASGLSGSSMAIATMLSEVTVSQRFGWLEKGLRRVRMMNITSTYVAIDSTNQPVRNSVSPASNTAMSR